MSLLSVVTLVLGMTNLENVERVRGNTHTSAEQGFHFRLTGGVGYATMPGAIDGATTNSAIYMGGTVLRGIIVGGYLDGLYTPSPKINPRATAIVDDVWSQTRLGVYVDYYLPEVDGVHFLSTVGFTVNQLSMNNLESSSSIQGGVALGFGVGYDWRLGEKWNVGWLAKCDYFTETFGDAELRSLTPAMSVSLSYH